MKILENGIAVLDDDTHISRWVEQTGKLCHDDCVGLFILPLLKPGYVVVDAGAFIGDHTIAYLEKVGPTGKVYAFEPNPDAYECLKHNCKEAIKFRYALSNDTEHRYLSIAPNAGSSHITKEETTVSIQSITLDSLNLPKLDFVKLDIEGYEVMALKGGEKTIKQFRPIMVIEMNDGALLNHGESPDSLMDLLDYFGYTVKSLHPNLSMSEPMLDILCEPKL